MNKTVNCPTGSKRGWPTKFAADQALGSIWRSGFHRGPGKLPTRPYRCVCGQWHLTSQGFR